MNAPVLLGLPAQFIIVPGLWMGKQQIISRVSRRVLVLVQHAGDDQIIGRSGRRRASIPLNGTDEYFMALLADKTQSEWGAAATTTTRTT